MAEKYPYELWAYTGKKLERVGTYSSIKQLQKAWLAAQYSSLEARNIVGGKVYVVNDRMPQRLLQTLGFQSAEGRDKYIEANAKYFTVVRRSGVGAYERHERKTRKGAERLGEKLSIANKCNYIIYAVGPNDLSAYVTTVYYNQSKQPRKT